MALNSNSAANRSNRNQSSTTITSLITKLQQSFSDAMSTQKTVVDKRAFDKTYKNMDKVCLLLIPSLSALFGYSQFSTFVHYYFQYIYTYIPQYLCIQCIGWWTI